MPSTIYQKIVSDARENPGIAMGIYGIIVTIIVGCIPFIIQKLDTSQKLLLVSLGITIVLFCILIIIVSRTTKNIDDRLSIEKEGFIYINEYDLFKTLSNSIKSAQTNLLVIGDGYSKKKNNKYERESKRYFLTIENKLKLDKAFIYRRVTSNKIPADSPFYSHLVNLFIIQNSNINISFLPYFKGVNTFVIVDNHTLILNASHKDISDECESNYVCRNPKIVQIYRDLFDMIFDRSLKLETLDDLEFARKKGKDYWKKMKNIYIEVPKKLSKELEIKEFAEFYSEFFRTIDILYDTCIDPKRQLKRLNNLNNLTHTLIRAFKNIRELPDGSMSHEYANIQVEEMHEKIAGLVNGHLSISHDKEYEGNFYILKSFFSRLSPKDNYHTISLDQFWIRLSEPDLRYFKDINEEKIIKGVSISRILVLREKTFYSQDSGEILFYTELIKEQKGLAQKYPNYQFDFCFLPESDEGTTATKSDKFDYQSQHWNQVYLKQGDEQVFIRFSYNRDHRFSSKDVQSEIITNSFGGNQFLFDSTLREYNRTYDRLKDICNEQKVNHDLYKGF